MKFSFESLISLHSNQHAEFVNCNYSLHLSHSLLGLHKPQILSHVPAGVGEDEEEEQKEDEQEEEKTEEEISSVGDDCDACPRHCPPSYVCGGGGVGGGVSSHSCSQHWPRRAPPPRCSRGPPRSPG
jgi:hypothetical protein